MTITTVHRPLLDWSLSVRQSGRGFVVVCQSRQSGRGFVLVCQSRQSGRGTVLVCHRTGRLGRGLAPTRSQGTIYYGVLAQWDVRLERLDRVELQKFGELFLHHL